MVDQSLHRHLDAFLVENPELEQLNARLSEFNIFRTLNIAHQEIRHSNTLGWLLDPAESHGLGDRFLRRFFSRLLIENEGLNTSLSAARMELMEFGWVDVRREWNNIDIFVRSASGKWILLIENKVYSKESAGQLKRYRDIIEEEYPGEEVIPVFLTLDGDDPSEEGQESGYIGLSHADVLSVAQGIFDQYHTRMSDDARMFLEHYLKTLRRMTMQDEELAALCKTIYRKHREAIDLIVQYGAQSQVLENVEEAVKVSAVATHTQIAANRVYWLTPEMAKFVNAEELVAWKFLEKPAPVYWWIFHGRKRGRLHLALEVGPIADSEKRRKLLATVERHGFSVGSWVKDDAKFTRIFSFGKKFKPDENGDPDESPEAVKKLALELIEKSKEMNAAIAQALQDWAKLR